MSNTINLDAPSVGATLVVPSYTERAYAAKDAVVNGATAAGKTLFTREGQNATRSAVENAASSAKQKAGKAWSNFKTKASEFSKKITSSENWKAAAAKVQKAKAKFVEAVKNNTHENMVAPSAFFQSVSYKAGELNTDGTVNQKVAVENKLREIYNFGSEFQKAADKGGIGLAQFVQTVARAFLYVALTLATLGTMWFFNYGESVKNFVENTAILAGRATRFGYNVVVKGGELTVKTAVTALGALGLGAAAGLKKVGEKLAPVGKAIANTFYYNSKRIAALEEMNAKLISALDGDIDNLQAQATERREEVDFLDAENDTRKAELGKLAHLTAKLHGQVNAQ